MPNSLLTKFLLKLSTDKKARNISIGTGIGCLSIIAFIIILPVILIGSIFSLFSPSSEDIKSDIFYISKEEIRLEQNIKNDIHISVIKYPYMIKNKIQNEEYKKEEVKYFISSFFVKSEDEQNRFLNYDEVMQILPHEPFNLSEDDISLFKQIYMHNSELEFNGRFPMPVKGTITSRYGYRSDPFGNPTAEFHKGLDIQPEHHSPINTIADGEVIEVNTKTNSYGNYVLIKHEIDNEVFYSFYAHLSEVTVSVNEKVIQGQVIGLEGGEPKKDPNPGSSTGHHLHFEIRKSPGNNSTVNPEKYLFNA